MEIKEKNQHIYFRLSFWHICKRTKEIKTTTTHIPNLSKPKLEKKGTNSICVCNFVVTYYAEKKYVSKELKQKRCLLALPFLAVGNPISQ